MVVSIDIDSLRAAPVRRDPFPYLIVPNFVRAEALAGIEADYPQVTVPGSVPLPSLRYGEKFAQFMEDIRGPAMTTAIAEKFAIDLSRRPTTITVRGQCRAQDGQIHTDSTSKLITVLIYMNSRWQQTGGQLRLLRSPHDLNDMVAEVPPEQGTLLAFRNQPNAWHGHAPFTGERRVIQLNWVTSKGVVRREHIRHRISAFFKKLGMRDVY